MLPSFDLLSADRVYPDEMGTAIVVTGLFKSGVGF